jgi:ABC-type Mn2+/Zn2+ transport system ATPase subunit
VNRLDDPIRRSDAVDIVALVRLEKAEIGYGKPLLPPVDLTVQAGARLAVLGPNGGGKSTLVRTLVGLLPLLSGRRVFRPGTPVRIGYVPQAHRADPVFPLTTLEVVLQGRYGRVGLGRRVRDSDRRIAANRLEQVGLVQQAGQPFRSLSGGQRQRTLLARALCSEPELLVLDEFTSELDPAGAAALLGEVSRLGISEGVSVVFVTHEIQAAAQWSTQVALVDTRHSLFETGERDVLLTSEHLSRLYGQDIHIERRGERTVVFVESGGGR